MKRKSQDKAKKILLISSDRSLVDVLKFCFEGWGYEMMIYEESAFKDAGLIKKIRPDAVVVDVMFATKTNLEICRIMKDDLMTSLIPVITLINKKQLRSELLSLKHGVDDYLVKPPDPLDLRVRVEMAIRKSQFMFYASPLTGLPGGRIIEEELKKRMAQDTKFAFAYLDIDNFKYFNDVYGYLKGDRVIMQTAYMLYTTLKNFGNPDDFIGHVGGDDFVFITSVDKYETVCEKFISAFNKTIQFHYSEKDRMNGYIVAKDRSKKVKNIPLMSISIAIACRRSEKDFNNVIDMNERVAEVKRYLKGFEGSKFMEDRRSRKAKEVEPLKIFKIEPQPEGSYRPLGQLLLEKHIVSAEKLDEALAMHWKRGIMLGEALTEMGAVKQDQIDSIVKSEKEKAQTEPEPQTADAPLN